jgi:hypothetical protein
MDGRDSTHSLLVLRKLTRAIADVVRAQMTEYLATLAPLLRPKMVLGEHVEDGTKESIRRSDKAFKELQSLYETVSTAKPFNLPRELTLPLRLVGSGRDAHDHGPLAADLDADLLGLSPDAAPRAAEDEAADGR